MPYLSKPSLILLMFFLISSNSLEFSLSLKLDLLVVFELGLELLLFAGEDVVDVAVDVAVDAVADSGGKFSIKSLIT